MRVQEMSPTDRPSVRLKNLGTHALTTSELLAVVIGGDNGVESAAQLYASCEGSLRRLAAMPRASLTRCAGIGEATADKCWPCSKLGADTAPKRGQMANQ